MNPVNNCEGCAKENIKPISVTFLSEYLFCPRKLYLSKVLKLEEVPTKALVLGSIQHKFYDLISKAEKDLVISLKSQIQLDELKSKFRHNYSQLVRKSLLKYKKQLRELSLSMIDVFRQKWPLISLEADEKAHHVYDFMIQSGLFGEELWDSLVPKIFAEKRIVSKKYGLKGIVDKIKEYDNLFEVIEIKTGSIPKQGIWPGHKIQAAAYVLMFEELNVAQDIKKPIKGFVHYIGEESPREIVINPFLREEILELIVKVRNIIFGKEVPQKIDKINRCNACSLKGKCFNL